MDLWYLHSEIIFPFELEWLYRSISIKRSCRNPTSSITPSYKIAPESITTFIGFFNHELQSVLSSSVPGVEHVEIITVCMVLGSHVFGHPVYIMLILWISSSSSTTGFCFWASATTTRAAARVPSFALFGVTTHFKMTPVAALPALVVTWGTAILHKMAHFIAPLAFSPLFWIGRRCLLGCWGWE